MDEVFTSILARAIKRRPANRQGNSVRKQSYRWLIISHFANPTNKTDAYFLRVRHYFAKLLTWKGYLNENKHFEKVRRLKLDRRENVTLIKQMLTCLD